MKKSMVVTTIAMILVVVVAITTATFAWFSVSTSANVTGSFTAGSGSTTIVLFDPTKNSINYGAENTTTNANLYEAFNQRSNWSSLLDLGSTNEMQPLVPIGASNAAASGNEGTGLDGVLDKSAFAFPTAAFSGTNATAGVYPEFAYAITQNNPYVNGSTTDPSLNIIKQAAADWTKETANSTPSGGQLQQSLFLATFYLANFSGTPQPQAPITITISAPDNANNNKVIDAARFMMVTAPVNKAADAASSYIYRKDTNYGITYDKKLVTGGDATGNALIANNYATALLTKGGDEVKATGMIDNDNGIVATTKTENSTTTYTFTSTISLPVATLGDNVTGVVAVSLAVWLDGWVLNNDGDAGTFNFSLTVAQAESGGQG